MITGRVFEEEGNWYVQDAGDVLETAGTNPVRAFFVFLDLLERQADGLAQCRLGHAQECAAQPDATSNISVNRCSLCNFVFSLGSISSTRHATQPILIRERLRSLYNLSAYASKCTFPDLSWTGGTRMAS